MICLSIVSRVLVVTIVQRPLERLQASMQEVRDGNLLTRAETGTRDEIGRLASEFNSMTSALKSARERLEIESEKRRALETGLQRIDKLASVGQLAAGLAHEIGSPLQVLNGRAGRLANRRDLPADAQRDAEILVQQTDRIAGIVGQLLTFARRKAPRFEEINMVDVTGAVIDLLGYEVKHRAVKPTSITTRRCRESSPIAVRYSRLFSIF